MIKKIVFLMFILVSFVNADKIDILTYKDVISPGETVQVSLQINEDPIYPPGATHISLVDSSGKNVKIAPFVYRVKNNFYFYTFKMPELDDGVYTLGFSPFKYVVNQTLKEFSFFKNISVKKSDYTLIFHPAFFIFDDTLELKITSTNGDANLTVSAPEFVNHPYNTPQYLREKTSRYLNFNINNKSGQEYRINFSFGSQTYQIPLFNKIVFSEDVKYDEDSPKIFEFTPEKIKKDLEEIGSLEGTIEIKNLLKEILRVDFEISQELKDIIKLNTSSLLIEPEKMAKQYIWVNKDNLDYSGLFSGVIKIKAKDFVSEMPVEIRFGEDETFPEELIIEENEEEIKEEAESGFEELTILPEVETEEAGPKSSAKTPIILALLVLIIMLLFYIFGRKKTEEQSFDEYLENMSKKRS